MERIPERFGRPFPSYIYLEQGRKKACRSCSRRKLCLQAEPTPITHIIPDRLVSFFYTEVRPIKKGKLSKVTEFGFKARIVETESGAFRRFIVPTLGIMGRVPGSYQHWGKSSFRVRNKIFAVIQSDGVSVAIKTTHDDLFTYTSMDPEVFSVPDSFTKLSL